MAENKIPERNQLPVEYTWELSDIFKSDELWQKALEEAAGLKEKFAAFQGRLAESADTLLAFFRLDDEAGLALERIYTYANCKSDQDTADSFYRDMRGKAMGVYVEVSAAAAFAKPEIIAIDEQRLNCFYEQQLHNHKTNRLYLHHQILNHTVLSYVIPKTSLSYLLLLLL